MYHSFSLDSQHKQTNQEADYNRRAAAKQKCIID